MASSTRKMRNRAVLSFNCRAIVRQSKQPEEVYPFPHTKEDVYGSHIKPVVGFAAVQADLFAAHDANPVCTDAFAAAFADVGIEQLYLHNPGRGIN